jgi:hypothetical protein
MLMFVEDVGRHTPSTHRRLDGPARVTGRRQDLLHDGQLTSEMVMKGRPDGRADHRLAQWRDRDGPQLASRLA